MICTLYVDVIFTKDLDDLDAQKPRFASVLESAGYTRPSSSLRTMFAMLSDPLSINRSFKSRKASHSSYPKSMSTSRFESIKGSSWEKLSPILENQRKFGLLAFQSQGLSLRSLGSLTLVQLPAKRSDVPCTELGGSESGNAETWDHSSLALTRSYFFFIFLGGPRILTVWSRFPESKGFRGFPQNLTSERPDGADVLGFCPRHDKVYPMRARTKACDFESHQTILPAATRQDISSWEHQTKTNSKTLWLFDTGTLVCFFYLNWVMRHSISTSRH